MTSKARHIISTTGSLPLLHSNPPYYKQVAEGGKGRGRVGEASFNVYLNIIVVHIILISVRLCVCMGKTTTEMVPEVPRKNGENGKGGGKWVGGEGKGR